MAFTKRISAELREDAAEDGSGAGFGTSLRAMRGADLDHVRALRDVVRWSAEPGAFDLLRGVRDARWAVAEVRGGALVGTVGAVPLGNVGMICHLAVREDYRGLGLGARLTSWAVAYLRSRGTDVIRLFFTRPAEKIYCSAGFEPSTPRTVYRLNGMNGKVWRTGAYTGGHRVEALTARDLPEVCGLDLWSHGADRSALILATLRSQHARGLVARDSAERIKGYLIRSSTPHADHVGPFLAEGLDVARLLMDHAQESNAKPVTVTVTTPEGASAHRLFGELGFVGRKDRIKMELGAIPAMRWKKGLEHYGTTPYLAT